MKITSVAYVFAVIGLLVSVYLTLVRYTSVVPLACPSSGVINCENVLSSQYSTIFGIPNAVLGMVFFVAEIIAIRMYFKTDYFLMLNGIGLAFVLYYVTAEYVLSSICLFCTAVHVCVLALLAIAIKYSGKAKPTSS